MEKVDIDKFVCSLRKRFGEIKGVAIKLDDCLRDQGLKYYDTPDGGRLGEFKKGKPKKNRAADWSEDEGISEKIITTIHLYYGEPLENEAKEMIAWLEKQGEHANFCNNIQIGDKVTRNKDGVLVNLSQLNRVAKKLGEQKSIKVPKFKVGDFIQFKGMGHTRYTVKEVCGLSHYINTCNKRMDMSYTDANFELVEQKPAEWSEDCERYISYILTNCMHYAEETGYVERKNNPIIHQQAKDWLESLKERVQPQPKQEWSEEDESKIKGIINTLEGLYDNAASDTTKDLYRAKIDWLKSLKPQITWKPTAEQMKVLKETCVLKKSTETGAVLCELYHDLEKLREE